MKLNNRQKEKFNNLIRNQALLSDDIEISENKKFYYDFGFDSLDFIELIMDVEIHFEISIPDEKAEKIKTVKEAYDLLAAILSDKK